MNVVGAIVGGAVGGVVGAGIWIGVGMATGYELGWIAWGIGALTGLGVMKGSGDEGGAIGGGIAVAFAIVAILVGKWFVIQLAISQWSSDEDIAISEFADMILDDDGTQIPTSRFITAESLEDAYPANVWAQAKQQFEALDPATQDEVVQYPDLANPDAFLVWIADDIVGEYESQNRMVDWPSGFSIEEAWRSSHYPEDVWADAQARWDSMSQQERDGVRNDIKSMIDFTDSMVSEEIGWEGFKQSFALYDLLWAALAIGTAAKLGAVGVGDE